MGLDITAYRQLTPIAGATVSQDGEVDDYDTQWYPGPSMEWSESHWPGHGKGVDAYTVYSFSEKFSFRAGSYGGYNAWRDDLARVVGLHSARDCYEGGLVGPFSELLNLADNEGVIGTVVSAKLAADFAKFADRAATHWHDRPYSLEKYQAWRKAFEMATDNGAVRFH